MSSFENKLYVITESRISKDRSNEQIVKAAIAGGAEIIQLREKSWSKAKIREDAIRLVQICHEHDVLFIVNDHVDVALEVGADGVHLGQEDMGIPEARLICGDKLMIGLSCHSLEQAIEADSMDIDYITIGPIFPTRAKNYTVDADLIQPILQCTHKPLIAIGGITKENIDEVLSQGVSSVAVISAVVAYEDVKKAARELVEKIKR